MEGGEGKASFGGFGVATTEMVIEAESVRDRMVERIRARFGHLLGNDGVLLNTPEGLDALSSKGLARLRGSYAGVWESFPSLGGPG